MHVATVQNVFAVTNELQRPTPDRINSVIALAIAVAFVIYMIVAGCGYKTYGSNVLPDILVNYPRKFTSCGPLVYCISPL